MLELVALPSFNFPHFMNHLIGTRGKSPPKISGSCDSSISFDNVDFSSLSSTNSI